MLYRNHLIFTWPRVHEQQSRKKTIPELLLLVWLQCHYRALRHLLLVQNCNADACSDERYKDVFLFRDCIHWLWMMKQYTAREGITMHFDCSENNSHRQSFIFLNNNCLWNIFVLYRIWRRLKSFDFYLRQSHFFVITFSQVSILVKPHDQQTKFLK